MVEPFDVGLEVRPSNRPARGLYRKLGFAVIDRRRRYYSDNRENALVMRLSLGPGVVRGQSLKRSGNGCYDRSSTRPR